MDNIAASPIEKTSTPAAPPIQNVPVVAESSDTPFSLYEQVNGIPFTANHFGISKSQFHALKNADIDDTIPKMTKIDEYVRGRVQSERLIDSPKTYQAIIQEISSMLGIKDYEQPSAQIHKIFTYILGGDSYVRQFKVKRSSKAEEVDHAKTRAMKDLQSRFPNKTARLGKLFNTFTN